MSGDDDGSRHFGSMCDRFQTRRDHSELVHNKIAEATFGYGFGIIGNGKISFWWITDLYGSHNGVFIRFVFSGGGTGEAISENIIVYHQSPFPYTDRFVFCHDDIACKDIAAVYKPDMRMERVIDHDVVFYYTVKTFP